MRRDRFDAIDAEFIAFINDHAGGDFRFGVDRWTEPEALFMRWYSDQGGWQWISLGVPSCAGNAFALIAEHDPTRAEYLQVLWAAGGDALDRQAAKR